VLVEIVGAPSMRIMGLTIVRRERRAMATA
jgi:hypothetical protein